MAIRTVTPTTYTVSPHIPATQVREDLQPDCWVEWLGAPSDWCDCDVKLLCPTSDARVAWEVWIPAYGLATVATQELGSLAWCEQVKFLNLETLTP